jgi:hypothetical protein
MAPEKFDDYRKRIEDALRAGGFPVDQWKAEAERCQIENPRPRPATRVIEGYSKGTKMVRPGYEEYRSHGRHAGILVPRCLAKAHHGAQCGSIAMRDSYHCARHGGRRPGQYRKGQDHHWFDGKNESRAQRLHRKKCRDELKQLEKKASLEFTMDTRGPRPGTSWEKYWKGRKTRLAAKRRANAPGARKSARSSLQMEPISAERMEVGKGQVN